MDYNMANFNPCNHVSGASVNIVQLIIHPKMNIFILMIFKNMNMFVCIWSLKG